MNELLIELSPFWWTGAVWIGSILIACPFLYWNEMKSGVNENPFKNKWED